MTLEMIIGLKVSSCCQNYEDYKDYEDYEDCTFYGEDMDRITKVVMVNKMT